MGVRGIFVYKFISVCYGGLFVKLFVDQSMGTAWEASTNVVHRKYSDSVLKLI